MFIGGKDEPDTVLTEILQYQVDAIVMASTTLSPDVAKSCADAGVPVVLFNRVPDMSAPAHRTASTVTSDNYSGGRLAGELLVARGHKRIAFLAGLENSSTSIERERGFNDVLREAGVHPFARAVGHYQFQGAQKATRALFKGARQPDGIFVANDHMAIAALDVLRIELKLRVPHDVSVVGFDDVPQAAWGAYSLTTVVQSVERMVDATVGLLLQQIQEGASPRNVVIPCQLVERQSVRGFR
jgi:DNA-binding LacI/PurR family transcriptional regulator